MKEFAIIQQPLTKVPITEKTLWAVAEQSIEARSILPSARRTNYCNIRVFFQFVKKNDFTRDVFRRYKRFLTERTDIAQATKQNYFCEARAFLRELHYVGIINTDITLNVRGFTKDKKHKRDGLAQHELKLVIKKIRCMPPTTKNNRLKAILALMLFQGLRQEEISRFKLADIDLINKRAFIVGKNRAVRRDPELIDLHPETRRALKTYLSTRDLSCRNNAKKPVHTCNEYLFPGRRNYGGVPNRPIRRQTPGDIMKEFFQELGINRPPAVLRHTYVVALIKQFKDLRKVQQFTRHKTLDMLMVYDDRLKQQADLPVYYKAFENINF